MDDSDRLLLDHRLISEVLFYPQPLSESDVPALESGQILRVPAGRESLGAYYYRPLPDAPTVLFFHGNGEVMTDYLYDYHDSAARAGANLLVVDYRGYGLSTGRPTLSRILEDARAAWSYATGPLGLRASELVVMGRSLGSLAALEVVSGLGSAAAGLVIESGMARFDDWINRMAGLISAMGVDVDLLKQALRRHFDHEAKIKSFSGPVLILHSLHDEIVPVEHGRALADWAGDERTESRIFSQGGHNDIQARNRDEYFEALGRFLSDLG